MNYAEPYVVSVGLSVFVATLGAVLTANGLTLYYTEWRAKRRNTWRKG